MKGLFSHHNYVTLRPMKNYNAGKFIVSLVQGDWSNIFTAENANKAWEN